MSAAETVKNTQATSTTGEDWQLVVTSPWMRKLAWILIAVVMVVHIFMAVVSGVGDTGATVTGVDQVSFIGLGLLISAACLLLRRPRVRVNRRGVEVRNIFGAQFYPWEMIHGLSFPRNSRSARLELPDFEFVPMMAMQIGDKATIAGTVEAFRTLEDQYMPDE